MELSGLGEDLRRILASEALDLLQGCFSSRKIDHEVETVEDWRYG